MVKSAMWMMVALVAICPVTVWADDEEPEEKPHETVEEPPPLAELREEHLAEETGPVDPTEYLRSYRDWVAEHEQAPPHTASDRVLYDVWRAALQPRARRMSRRIETMMTRKYWLPAIGTPERINPKYWPRFTRELAGLYSELQGAWKQYEDPKIREGMNVRQVKRYWGYMGYGFPAARWRGAISTRQAVGIGYGPVELYSYRNLMNRYRTGWGWRRQECYFCEERRRELQEETGHRAGRLELLERVLETRP